MICSKVIPAFYLIELSGDSTDLIVKAEYSIDRINMCSTEFSTDLGAINGLQSILSRLSMKLTNAETETSYNPEFFPTLATQSVVDEFSDEIQGEQFDEMGSFVVARSVLTTGDATITGKIIADPIKYAAENEVVMGQPPKMLNCEQALRIH